MSESTSRTVPEEIKMMRSKFVEMIYGYTASEVNRDLEPLLGMLYDMGKYKTMFLGRVIRTNILVESVDENFKKSFLSNIAEVQDPYEMKKLEDSRFFSSLINKQSSYNIVNLYIQEEMKETGVQIYGVIPQIYFVGYQVPIKGTTYEVTMNGNITFAYKDIVAVELFHCDEMNETKRETISKMHGFLQRFAYTPERIKELLYVANGLDAMIRMRNKKSKRFTQHYFPYSPQ